MLVLWKHPGLLHKRWLGGRFMPFYCKDKYFYCPQWRWGKVIFSVACVKNSVHSGRSTWAGTLRAATPSWVGTPPWLMSGRYASYWNAFLLSLNSVKIFKNSIYWKRCMHLCLSQTYSSKYMAISLLKFHVIRSLSACMFSYKPRKNNRQLRGKDMEEQKE